MDVSEFISLGFLHLPGRNLLYSLGKAAGNSKERYQAEISKGPHWLHKLNLNSFLKLSGHI